MTVNPCRVDNERLSADTSSIVRPRESGSTGGNGNDILRGGSGDDELAGGNGNNIFAFAGGFGHNTVSDFGHDDRIEFDGGVFQNFAAVEAASRQVGNDTVITLDAGNSIVLQHVSMSSLHASNFLFA